MKFSACVLTAGMLLAIAAAVSSSELNPFEKAFSVLDDDNILPRTTDCHPPGPTDFIQSLKITGCSQVKYPCLYEHNKSYNITPTITCGARYQNCQIKLSLNFFLFELTILTLPAEAGFVCSVGQTVSPVFSYTVDPLKSPPGMYHVEIKLVCDGALVFCRGLDTKITF